MSVDEGGAAHAAANASGLLKLADEPSSQAFVYEPSANLDAEVSLIADHPQHAPATRDFSLWADLLDPYRPSPHATLAGSEPQGNASALVLAESNVSKPAAF